MGFFQNLGSNLGGAADTAAGGVFNRAKSLGEGAINVVTYGQYGKNKELQSNLDQLSEKLAESQKASAEASADRPDRPDRSDWYDSLDRHLKEKAPEHDPAVADQIIGAQGESKMATHLVAEGDTLSEIAQDKGMDLSTLIDLNPDLENPDLIMPGQELNLGELSAQKSVSEKISEAAPTPSPTGPEADGAEV